MFLAKTCCFYVFDIVVLLNWVQNFLTDDGQQIEPEYYMPVIPMILVNGTEGIGTGWSTNVPNFCPRQIISNIRRLLDGEELESMEPDYYQYTGKIEADAKKLRTYNVRGTIERKDDTTLLISELPLKKWTQDYKVFLEGMLTSDGKKDTDLKDFKENHTDSTVSFTVIATKEKIDEFESGKDGLYGKFKLTSLIHASNMHLFDIDGRIVKYDSPEAILKHFFSVRLQYYSDRKENLLKNLRRDQRMLSNRARFVEEVCTGDMIVSNRKRKKLLSDLKQRGYDLLPKEGDKSKPQDDAEDEDDADENENEGEANLAKGYEYLLGMKIWSLTFEKAEKLRLELAEKTRAVDDLEATAPTQIWRNDLEAIEVAMDERDIDFAEAVDAELAAQNKTKKHQAAKKKKATKGRNPKKASKANSVNDDDDEDFVTESKKPKAKRAPKKAQTTRKKQNKVKVLDDDLVMEVETIEKKLPFESQVLNIDSDSEPETTDLSARLRHKLAISPAPKKVASDDTSSNRSCEEDMDVEFGRKRSSPRSREDSLDSFDADTYEPAPLTPAPKKMRRGNKKQEKQVKVTKKKICDKEMIPTKKSTKIPVKPSTKKRTSKKKIVEDLVSSDDDLFDEDLFDEDIDVKLKDSEPIPARSRSTRGGRPTIKYADLDDASDVELDDESDDESDF